MRFPFTFMGLLALAFGLWILAYLWSHRSLEPLTLAIALAAVVLSLGLGGYVLVRRVRRGREL